MISPLAYVDPAAKIGREVTIHPFAYIEGDTVIGDGCEIMPYASILSGTTLGRNVRVFQGAIIGATPQDFRWKGEPTRVTVGDNTIIREQVIINRSIHPEGATTVGAECFVLAKTHICHDTHVAPKCVLGNGVTLAGDVEVDEGSILSSNVIAHERSRIGKYTLIKGGTRISSNVPPFTIMAHNPVVYYGVNSWIMGKHAGFSPEEIEDVAKAYRHIYQTGTSMFNAIKRIETDIEDSRVRREIISFVRNNNYKLAGHRFDIEGDE